MKIITPHGDLSNSEFAEIIDKIGFVDWWQAKHGKCDTIELSAEEYRYWIKVFKYYKENRTILKIKPAIDRDIGYRFIDSIIFDELEYDGTLDDPLLHIKIKTAVLKGLLMGICFSPDLDNQITREAKRIIWELLFVPI